MKENLTVQKALNKGQFLLVILPLLVIFIFAGMGYLLKENGLGGTWLIVVSIIFGFSCGWMIWSYYVVKWKIWAYSNVRNVHELERKAIDAKLIWPDGSWFNKTEIWSNDDKQKWKRLQNKFSEADVYNDDFSVPKETELFTAKLEVYWAFGLGVAFFFIFGYLFAVRETLEAKENIVWLISPFVAIYFIYIGFKKLKKLKVPQLILGENGIFEATTNEHFPWSRIVDEHVSVVKDGSFLKFTALYDFNLPLMKGEVDDIEYELRYIEINISELDMKAPEIERRMRVYRVRYESTIIS